MSETITPSVTPSQASTPIIPFFLTKVIDPKVNWQWRSPAKAAGISFISMTQGWIVSQNHLLVTRDQGQSWQKLPDPPPGVQKLDFVDSDHGWAIGEDGLYATANGGKTWTRQFVESYGDFRPSLFLPPVLDFANSKVGWVSRFDGLYKTVDGGRAWQPASIPQLPFENASLSSLSFISPERGYLLYSFYNAPVAGLWLYKTVNGGASWRQVAQYDPGKGKGTMQGQDRPGFEYFFLDDRYGWNVGSIMADFYTEDGGKTWRDLRSLGFTGQHYSQLKMFTPKQGIAAYDGLGGAFAVVKTEDGARTWEPILLPVMPDEAIQFFDSKNGYGLEKQIGYGLMPEDTVKVLLSTQDGGMTWKKVAKVPCTDVQFMNAQVGWGTGGLDNHLQEANRLLYRTFDGGKTWEIVQTPPGLENIHSFFWGEMEGEIWDGNGQVFVTIDGGKSWQLLRSEQNGIQHSGYAGNWLETGDVLYHANTGDPVWSAVLKNGPKAHLNQISENEVFLSMDDSLVHTRDGGKTWVSIDIREMTDQIEPGFTVDFLDSHQGWLRSSQGLFHTSDGGQSWDQISPHLILTK